MAFFLRDWRHLQITISALLFLLAFTLFWCLPESPRWLLTKGRKKIAEKILRRTARINGTEFPEGLVEKVEIKKPPSTSARALLHAPNLMIKLLLIIVNWIVIDMAYYGIFLHAGNMSGNLYLNVLFYSLVEFPACALCFTIDRFGRKRPYIMCVVIGGLSCLSTLLVQYYASDELESTKYTKIALSVVGKLGVSAAYCILYIWSIEIFPTVIRNFCLGVGAVFAGVGSILSPIIVRDLKVESIGKDTLPLVIFGAMSIFGAICTIPLPETAKRDLPETIADAEKFPLGLKCTADDSEYQKPPLVDETTRV
ncbi:organic cation transporter protein-like [Lingula anatina]|uniref:Organic cation transporter protein-like n=1 Tax=Lingula anatina TaxID=7574 RepID=A0A1S3KAP3_LINAN|nr:organic cation transporter protein-like [Lingula anatina]|eukprot:XP_013419562.1 organic cation transporter protein-like [Lingula anatina]